MQPDSPLAVKVVPSPNMGERKPPRRPDMIILHYTGMPDAAGAIQWLCNPVSGVSCHYVVMEDGRIFQLVPEAARAWHAGAGSWAGETDINSASIGIEIVNPGHSNGYPAFPRRQIGGVIALCAGIVERHAIVPERVLAHSDIAPGRKIDPGEKFPWRRLAASGIGHFIEPAQRSRGNVLALGACGNAVEELQSMLEIYGYAVEISGQYDQVTRIVVEGFQRHFRPERVDGIADSSTLETLRRLFNSLPGLTG